LRVRRFRAGDEADLAEIFFSAIHEIASRHYSAEQVGAWAPQLPAAERFTARAADGRTILVAVDESDRPLAYGDLEADGHIDHLFCRPEVAGSGVAAAVYRALEAEAVGKGIERIYVEASEPARRFFAKQGFEMIERQEFELAGVPIHNFRMEKRLKSVPA
jgi:putative acetyltransferase